MDNNTKQQILVWGLIILGIGAIVLGMIGVITQKNQLGVLVSPVSAEDWIKGDNGAKVMIVEYSDFQCPACAYYYGLLKKLEQDFPNDLAFVFRHFPLEQTHKYARIAAQAAEAAGIQGKFWEMHDILFQSQDQWTNSADVADTRDLFITFAQLLKLDKDKFAADIDSEDISDKVQNDLIMGNEQKIQGTPTFFLNGKQIQNTQNYEEFKKLIEEEINK